MAVAAAAVDTGQITSLGPPIADSLGVRRFNVFFTRTTRIKMCLSSLKHISALAYKRRGDKANAIACRRLSYERRDIIHAYNTVHTCIMLYEFIRFSSSFFQLGRLERAL